MIEPESRLIEASNTSLHEFMISFYEPYHSNEEIEAYRTFLSQRDHSCDEVNEYTVAMIERENNAPGGTFIKANNVIAHEHLLKMMTQFLSDTELVDFSNWLVSEDHDMAQVSEYAKDAVIRQQAKGLRNHQYLV